MIRVDVLEPDRFRSEGSSVLRTKRVLTSAGCCSSAD
jgi:hypothetical protein